MKKRYLQILIGVFIIIFMVLNPKEVFDAAVLGLTAWWKMVFPALLPFFIGSQLLLGFGVVRFMGVLLEPIMRPLFNLPGAASFVMAMGFTSGTPIGAVITAQLREEQVLSKGESERVMSFCNNSSPLFMLAAVSVGMFNRPTLGLFIASAHYMANILIGLLLGFLSRKKNQVSAVPQKGIWRRAINELVLAHRKNPQPLGYFLGEAIKNSVQTLLMIGGFIVFFSVLIRIFTIIGIIDLIGSLFSILLSPLGFTPSIITALASGLFEMTLGTKAASEASAPILQQVIVASVILGWSGLAIHAQVATIIAKTDLNMNLYMITRALQGILAGCFVWILLKIFKPSLELIEPTLGSYLSDPNSYTWFIVFQEYSLLFVAATVALFLLALFFHTISNLLHLRSRL